MFAVFKDELAARKLLKAFFLQPKKNTLIFFGTGFRSVCGEISTKDFLKFCRLISNLILGQIGVSNFKTALDS